MADADNQLAKLLERLITGSTDIASLIELGSAELCFAEPICQKLNVAYRQQPPDKESLPQQRFDIALLHLSTPNTFNLHLIGELKNRLTHRILAFSNSSYDPFAPHYLAHGFIKEKSSNGAKFLIYSYNITTYNRTRSWNNPSHWANPQNWDKRF